MSFHCPACGAVSHNPNDEREGYCGQCHAFTGATPERLVASESTPRQLIGELHCWIATYADGTEGIIAGGLPGIGMTPLISSRRHVAEAMGKTAEHAASLSGGKVVGVRLVTFRSTDPRHRQ